MYEEIMKIAETEGAKIVRPTRAYQPAQIAGTRNEMHPIFDYINAHEDDITCEPYNNTYTVHIGYKIIILTVLP